MWKSIARNVRSESFGEAFGGVGAGLLQIGIEYHCDVANKDSAQFGDFDAVGAQSDQVISFELLERIHLFLKVLIELQREILLDLGLDQYEVAQKAIDHPPAEFVF